MIATFEEKPMPASRITMGTRAMVGMGRSTLTIPLNAAFTGLNSPIKNPATTPQTAPIT